MKTSFFTFLAVIFWFHSHAQWSTLPGVATPICTASENQRFPKMVSDGAGGAIVVWIDDRNLLDEDIYIQRINALGEKEWSEDGLAVCTATGSQNAPVLVEDGAGGVIVGWIDKRDGVFEQVFVQHINAAGTIQWAANGIEVTAGAYNHVELSITTDGAGGAILLWMDSRSTTQFDLYAQRINNSGVLQWTTEGVAICTVAPNPKTNKLIADGSGGAILVWEDNRILNDYDIYIQKINFAGQTQFPNNGIAICSATGKQHSAVAVSDGFGGAFVSWSDWRGGNMVNDVYCQHMDASGVAQWTANGLPLYIGTLTIGTPAILRNPSGGIFVAWTDFREGSNKNGLYVQKINSSGTLQWTEGGESISSTTANKYFYAMASDSIGGAYISWLDDLHHVNIQHINSSGTGQWSSDLILSNSSTLQINPSILADSAGGAIVVWEDYQAGANNDIFGQNVLLETTLPTEILDATDATFNSVFPNPTQDGFIFHSKKEGNYLIVNELGIVVRSISLDENNSFFCKIENLHQGIYYLVGATGTNSIRQKLIVIK